MSPAEAFRNAAQLMAAGAQMVKLEGGETMVETINFLTSRGIPVCGHLGLTPQSVNTLGGYRIQGKTDSAIGIGAGVDCSGQVLVLHDMLDIFPGKKARFVKNYLAGAGSVQAAVETYVKEVKAKTFPAAEHSY